MTADPIAENEIDLSLLLDQMVELGGSDLLLKVANRPLLRVRGDLQVIGDDHAPLRSWQTEHLLYNMLTTARIKEFENNGEIDFA